MSAELTTDQKRDVVLAAVIAAGPGANDNQVASQVTRILGLTASGSVVMNAFDRAAARAEKTTQVDHFNGDLIYVDLEETSQRPVYFFRTSVSKYAPQGIEFARVDRFDDADLGEASKALANEALALIGHAVTITKAIEKTTENQNARVIRGFQDRGEAQDFPGGTDNKLSWQMIDWDNGGVNRAFAALAPKLKRLKTYRQPVPA